MNLHKTEMETLVRNGEYHNSPFKPLTYSDSKFMKTISNYYFSMDYNGYLILKRRLHINFNQPFHYKTIYLKE